MMQQECMTYFKLWPLVFVDRPVIQLNLRIKMNKEQTNVFIEGEVGGGSRSFEYDTC